MDTSFQETCELTFAATLDAVPAAAARIGTWLRLRGFPEPQWPPLEIAVVEGLNNAVLHGCAGMDEAAIRVRLSWSGCDLSIRVTDPGHFEPGPDWGNLPEDPLAESGRGGFLMREAFERVEHVNDREGHTLVLTMRTEAPPADPDRFLETFTAIEQASMELERSYETIAGLRFLISLLATSGDSKSLVRQALERLREIDTFKYACVRRLQGTALRLYCTVGDGGSLPEIVPLGDPCTEADAVLRLETRRIDACEALGAEDPLHGTGGAALAVPVCYEDNRIGTITLVRQVGEPFFRSGTVEMLQTIAEFLGVTWESDRLHARQRELEVNQHELTLAAQMQARLLPEQFPETPRLTFSGSCMSARKVGGDFYDVFSIAGGTVLVIADAMGKGVPAAFVASILRCAIRARDDLARDPGRLLTEVNRQITPDLLKVDIFITALVGFIPDGADRVLIASAGHCPPLIRRNDGRVDRIEGGGPPLGVLCGELDFPTVTCPLSHGDAVVFLTDGVYEIGPQAEASLGLNWIAEILARTGDPDPHSIVESLIEAGRARARGEPAQDDRTLLVCTRAHDPAVDTSDRETHAAGVASR
ncbi:MAG: hypothetical protein D6781_02150 [Verrucomicrobia bacterium]|nr:MAG: hypothetical protein D6781_02150 [Verrucomicrobiota bacterium]